MKKSIKIAIAIVILSTIGFLGYKITSKLNHKKEVAERTQSIPEFSFETLTGSIFTENNLTKAPAIFVYFNSDCDYCQAEATKIQKHLRDFKNTQIIFVSFENKDGIQKFAKDYKLDKEANITFLEDSKGEFSKIFDVNSIPYIVVYDNNKQLLKKFKGATKVSDILDVLK
ncbi:AhpC/TSA family protein [Tenacibaculum sp. MAR_2009_124]|uniref:TlpA family protein disulfide reductase n=1 Tax=Tenacibaculum sp. MAR_2009_124 TaxID=1250059 RepID=UPI00089CC656|nr:TlpA disulfide reductase family protein [Tenacibaculum sp. MAR_2009_124]SEC53084.1 AhpC/TSA family protein [Tenacibaculum sp. MAR_2009_124]